ncbi:hypothetical protein COCMIDRAFT_40153 [Bipolaris oryzae ATCC 44560]|uniref:Uncharacterized protein n=1 Tax=Bipolaris oryzae ATCC 44560 TaxID=930090 RepID=W6YVZ0_COCMI|nr:uncharacterized protein COCMIDRAFT_40153 [Bipolaris oryzae ATCC 44560]EUC41695.1 hypothetical protein COCMIDRAFT_40153 [Bipolaris oryzae ATCC 44560]
MSALKSFALLSTLPFLALGATRRAAARNFIFYGYSDQFGGSPLIYSDGYAYVGSIDATNTTDAAIVNFTSTTNNEWLGSPNVTVPGHTSSWSNATFFIPTADDSDKRVGFLTSNSTIDGKAISGFRLYGSMAAFVTDDGQLVSAWTGLQVSQNLHRLYWNDTSLGQIPVTLTTVAPSNPSN